MTTRTHSRRDRNISLLVNAANQLLDGHINDDDFKATISNLLRLHGPDLDDATNVLTTAAARDDHHVILAAAQQIVDEWTPQPRTRRHRHTHALS